MDHCKGESIIWWHLSFLLFLHFVQELLLYNASLFWLIEPQFFCKCRDEKLHFEKSHALAESRLILLPTGEQLRSFHSMSPNTCIKICILSLCILSLLWIHLPILESDCGHLAAYTWLNASHLILQTWGRNWSEILIKLYLMRRISGWWDICKSIALQHAQAIVVLHWAAALDQGSSSLPHIIVSAPSSICGRQKFLS